MIKRKKINLKQTYFQNNICKNFINENQNKNNIGVIKEMIMNIINQDNTQINKNNFNQNY